MLKKELPLRERLRTATQLASRTRVFFDIWWHYEGIDTRGEILDRLNVYPEFFRFDIHAHFVSFIIHIAALFEERTDSVNIRKLVEDSARQLPIPTSSKVKIARALVGAKSTIPKISILRGNLFAHRSAKISYKRAFELADVTPDELRALSDCSFQVLDLLAREMSEPGPVHNDSAVKHLQSLIDEIENLREV